jgi:HrpA-like RNA helicase
VKYDEDEGRSSDEGEYDDDMDKVLNSIKLAYKKQQSYRNSQYQSSRLQRVNEIVDEARRQSQLVGRQRLPVASYKQQIIDIIQQNQVVVLSGATGSGKSTQIPQFLLEESIEHCDVESSPQQPHYRPYIIVTQPRRVAAISLATRVAQERGCPQPGTLGSSVGYMVRSDRRADLRSCRIIYMTIGVLLRILLNGSSESSHRGEKDEEEGENDDNVPPLTLESISHLVIDETHERDVNTDFVLTLLKSMMISVAKKKSQTTKETNTQHLPRLILMSATASTELFVNYFTLPPIVTAARIDIPGKIFPVETYWLSECEKMTGKTMTTRLSNHDDGVADELQSDGASSPRATEKIDDVFIRSLIVKIVEQQR